MVEEQTGKPIESAGMVTLDHVALYHEDLQDAFEHLGLRYLIFPIEHDVLYETSVVCASYDYDLCSDDTDRNACKQEQDDMPSDYCDGDVAHGYCSHSLPFYHEVGILSVRAT